MNSIIHPDYSTGKFSFYNADNMEIMKCYPDKYFELAIVDPPYGIGNPNHEKKTSALYKGKKWNSKVPEKKYWDELFRISKNQIVWGANYYTNYLPMKMGWIAWDKKIPGEPNGFSKIELAWTSFICGDDIVSIRVHQSDKIHPTQKPIALYSWLIKKYAKQGDKILDTHLGSGSIALAIDKANKLDGMDLSFVGIELDKDYFDAAINRFKDNSRQTAFNFE